MSNPFPPTTSTPGRGIVELAHIPPASSVLRTCSYQYPLKLVAPSPETAEDGKSVQTLYLLTYGGGLVAGDAINLTISVNPWTRLVLLTQGSTKIFKSPNRNTASQQHALFDVAPDSGLCYLPDPVQPFELSSFEQEQCYSLYVDPDGDGRIAGSLCVLDWVCRGRTARGENWKFWKYRSKNEVWLHQKVGGTIKRKLLLRDNLLLDSTTGEPECFASRVHDLGVYGTLILHGPMVTKLSSFFMSEFKLLPRLGARNWDAGSDTEDAEIDPAEIMRKSRQAQETADGVLWTVSTVRNCTVVKFGAKEVEGGKRWLKAMLEAEGSVPKRFGERALLCLR